MRNRAFIAGILVTLVAACVSGCGGGDSTPPTISPVGVAPTAYTYAGGQTTVDVVAYDGSASTPATEATAQLLTSGTLTPVGNAVTLVLQSGAAFRGTLSIPPNLTAQTVTYLARVSARDAAANEATRDSQAITVQGLDLPPPPPI